jgi:hypothetical protein
MLEIGHLRNRQIPQSKVLLCSSDYQPPRCTLHRHKSGLQGGAKFLSHCSHSIQDPAELQRAGCTAGAEGRWIKGKGTCTSAQSFLPYFHHLFITYGNAHYLPGTLLVLGGRKCQRDRPSLQHCLLFLGN